MKAKKIVFTERKDSITIDEVKDSSLPTAISLTKEGCEPLFVINYGERSAVFVSRNTHRPKSLESILSEFRDCTPYLANTNTRVIPPLGESEVHWDDVPETGLVMRKPLEDEGDIPIRFFVKRGRSPYNKGDGSYYYVGDTDTVD